ncbi:MAG: Rrf2 family transcriptional regulator [Bacteroidetes bacterium]|nr:Rrf2 family transcriptional regulator [Bacteroidota bacterium]
MRASSKFTIAIHICIYLDYSNDQLVSSQTLAESVKTNPVVIRRLIGQLRRQGIVGSVAGAKGGFYLAKPVDQLTLWDIYLVVRDDEFFNKPKVNPDCVVSSNLAVLVDDVYSESEHSMKNSMEKVTVAQLTDKLSDILEGSPLNQC